MNALLRASAMPFRQALSAAETRCLPLLISLFMVAVSAVGQAQEAGGVADAARQVHLLQYIAVDYAEAVQDGMIVNAEEYAEMREFAQIVATELVRLPPTPQRDGLREQALALQQLIEQQVPPATVAAQAERIRQGLLQAYDVVPLPANPPDLEAGRELYATQCASCHGREGFGDGPAAVGLEPAPSNFHDAERTRQLDVLAYFNTIRYGVEGTAMASYAHLPEQQRWNLSFYLASLADAPAATAGAGHWQGAAASEDFPDLATVIRTTPAQLASPEQRQVLAYLRANPGVFSADSDGSLATARDRLAQSLAAYRSGDTVAAQRHAVAAYLDGYELSESHLASRDAEFARDMENRMLQFRQLLRQGGDSAAVESAYTELVQGLDRAEAVLDQQGEDGFWLGFLGALVVLLREGLEAILVVAAILAFVRRVQGGSTTAIHWGWALALVAGFFTWLAAVTVISISGATREITEGVAALAAAAVLFYMGFWLHDKSHAASWQQYLKEHMQGALSSGSRFGLGALAFIAVYREAFETILFLQAIWVQAGADGRTGLISGGAVSVLGLVVLAILVLRFSARLPISKFFAFSALLMSILAIVFAGKGVVALQEAGWLPVHTVAFPRIDWLGIYPSWQSLGLQAVMLVLLGYLLFLRPRRQAGALAQ